MHRRARLIVVGFCGTAALLGVTACGPGFQAIYDGNVRFEHCYALEENPQAPMQDKALCWRDWSEHYTYGQTRDRVHYATARYVALSQAPNIPTDEALMMAAPGEARATTITAPAPTNAFAPPPRILEVKEQAAPKEASSVPVATPTAAAPPPPPAPLPGSICSDTCGTNYRGCGNGCDPAGKPVPPNTDEKACAACAKTYRGCMQSCFK